MSIPDGLQFDKFKATGLTPQLARQVKAPIRPTEHLRCAKGLVVIIINCGINKISL
jgi:hypothetical protein